LRLISPFPAGMDPQASRLGDSQQTSELSREFIGDSPRVLTKNVRTALQQCLKVFQDFGGGHCRSLSGILTTRIEGLP
jgi:hypothetical protein